MSKFKFPENSRPLTEEEKNKFNLSSEERGDIEALENGDYNIATGSEADKLKAAFKAAGQKIREARTASVTIRFDKNDLEKIKVKADQIGLKYQTYIKMKMHQDVLEN